jgi:hypothetical protein
MIKRLGIPETVVRCLERRKTVGRPLGNGHYDPDTLLLFVQDVEKYLNKDIYIRSEGRIFSIYCNDKALFDRMTRTLEGWIEAVYEPATGAEYQFMLDNGSKKVICNHLPFKRYQYRVYIKERIDAGLREKLWQWMDKYDGKFHTSATLDRWLLGKQLWITNPAIYVEDGPSLSMLLLFLGERVSRLEEFVPRSRINNQSKETTCLV